MTNAGNTVNWIKRIKKFFIDDDEPGLGDERVRSGFLWFPKAVREKTRWLTYATWRERYVWTRLGKGREVKAWRGVEWIDEDDGPAILAGPSIGFRAMERVLVEAVFRGGVYDGRRRKIHPDASRVELVSEPESGRVQVEAYELAGREEGRLVLEHVGTRIIDLADGE